MITEEQLQKLSPQPGDIFVVHCDQPVSRDLENEFRRDWTLAMTRLGHDPEKMLFVICGKGYRLELLDPEQLRQAGWVRADEASPKWTPGNQFL